jgi:N-acetylglucosamine-6-phosphate deacetylase
MKYPGGPAREFLGGGQESGGLVGSGLTMNLALKNAVKTLGLSLPEAAALCSGNPARVLGLDNERGRIEKGFCADFVLLDKDFSVEACFIAGKPAFMGKTLRT